MISFRFLEGTVVAQLPAAPGVPLTVKKRILEFRTDSPTALLHALTG